MGDDLDHYPPLLPPGRWSSYNPNSNNKYDLNSKIMLTAIISLSVVVLLVTALQIYARCVLRRQARRRAAIRQLGLAVSQMHTSNEPPKTGLDPAVIASLPIFTFKHAATDDGTGPTECAVCLSILEDDEMARLLPNCNHTFHAECIDKWLSAQSTCPICRTEAEPRPLPEPREPGAGAAPPSMAEGTSDGGLQSSAKIGGSSSRLSSFRRMLSRERSSRRIQSCGQEAGLEDIERQ